MLDPMLAMSLGLLNVPDARSRIAQHAILTSVGRTKIKRSKVGIDCCTMCPRGERKHSTSRCDLLNAHAPMPTTAAKCCYCMYIQNTEGEKELSNAHSGYRAPKTQRLLTGLRWVHGEVLADSGEMSIPGCARKWLMKMSLGARVQTQACC